MRLGSVLLFFHQPGSLQKDYSMTGKIKYAARGSKRTRDCQVEYLAHRLLLFQ